MLAKVLPNEKVATEEIKVVGSQTKPPARFSEATLLSAMEGAGKLIEDDELREAMREKGLGTPATRAQIIEGLILEKYVLREGRELQPTAKAFSLMTLLHGLGVPELFSPELTAEWEFKLAQMEHGKLKRESFMREIVKMTKHIVGQAKNFESDTIPGDFATLSVPCPKCGGEVHEKYKKFQCQACDFGIWKIFAGRQLETAEAESLLSKREVGPLDGFRSKLGRPFSAMLRLTDAYEVQFDFGDGAADSADAVAPDFTGQESLGPCPKCSSTGIRNACRVRLRKSGGSWQDLRLSLGTSDTAAPDRTCADAETFSDRQDRLAPFRLVAHAAAIRGVSGPPAGWQDRFRIRGKDGREAGRREGGARCGATGAWPSPEGQAAGRTAFRPLWALRQAWRSQRHDTGRKSGR